MAISTFKTFLMHKKEASTYEKLVDITEFPDLGSDPELLETTTTSDRMKTYILGILGNEGLKFPANYDHTAYKALKKLEGKTDGYAVWFGGTDNEDGTVTPTGTDGKFSFDGQLSVHVTGGKVNEVVGMSITIAPSTVIKGEVHDTIITNVTFGMNLSTSIAGKGETTQKQKYSQGGGLTKQQATILEKLRENLDKAMTAKEQAQLELNRLLSNSLGLNIVTIPQDDGTQVYYFCDGETLESSNIIYTFKANGFAWTKSWNDGNPVWKYGFSKDGNAIYNMLAAYKISTEYLDAECVTAEKLSAEYKQSVTTEMEETVDEKLTDYSTTEETKTLIANTGGTIRTEVAESVKTVTDTTNAKIDDRLAQAKDYTDSVHQEITTEYSTKLEETSKGFNMSVNSLTDRITEQGNEVNSYREQLQTYFGFSEDGLEIGKKVNGEKQQYSINIDNERMGFLQDGSEVAFIQYNKLHINAVEAMDRLSVGAAADGGYFDFISTEYGMGVKWRAVEKTDNASIVSVMKIPRRASKYVPVVDEDNIFQMEGVNEE